MLNFNGSLVKEVDVQLPYNNRGFAYGDAIFETLKVANSKAHFLEDHYFRLMASMRMLRMKIPFNFTLEFFESQIIMLLAANNIGGLARIKFTIFRDAKGFYAPDGNNIKFIIEAKLLEEYIINPSYEIELFKDFYVSKDQLSTLKTTAKPLNVLAAIFAKENNYNNCLLLNTDKQVVEALNANIFLVKGDVIITPPLADGCLNGIIRKKIIENIQKEKVYKFEERSVSPFEILKCDEMFLTNSIIGVQPVAKYRKKIFKNEIGLLFANKLKKLV